MFVHPHVCQNLHDFLLLYTMILRPVLIHETAVNEVWSFQENAKALRSHMRLKSYDASSDNQMEMYIIH